MQRVEPALQKAVPGLPLPPCPRLWSISKTMGDQQSLMPISSRDIGGWGLADFTTLPGNIPRGGHKEAGAASGGRPLKNLPMGWPSSLGSSPGDSGSVEEEDGERTESRSPISSPHQQGDLEQVF